MLPAPAMLELVRWRVTGGAFEAALRCCRSV
jgi:hypothetical protein